MGLFGAADYLESEALFLEVFSFHLVAEGALMEVDGHPQIAAVTRPA